MPHTDRNSAELNVMNARQLARTIDHTILKAEATEAQVRQVVAEAIEHRFAGVCVNPRYVKLVARLIEDARLADETQTDAPVLTCACVGFPLGANATLTKAIEASSCVKDGAQEIDMVIAVASLLEEDLDYARHDVMEVVKAARAVRRQTVVKVILETAVLNETQIALGCRAAQQGGADFVKTSTGFHPAGGATVAAVRALRNYCDNASRGFGSSSAAAGGGGGEAAGRDGMKVKAAGGIRDLPTALAMLEAGADRLGCSVSVAIVNACAADV
jgi:deoxyribose-phosphate aldolase